MPKHRPNKIWIDGDACPKAVKEIVFKTSHRLNINVVLVANSYQFIPHSDLIRLMVVHKGFDAADQHIIDQVEIHDIVITADIPLAAKVLEKRLSRSTLEAKFIQPILLVRFYPCVIL